MREDCKGMTGRVIDLAIEYIGSRGDCVGHWQDRPVYVPFSAAGDRLRVGIGQTRGDGFAARTEAVLAARPGRTLPPCRHFGDCGGCALQHLDDVTYSRWKVEQLALALKRRGFADPPLGPLVRVPAGSRRRASLAALRQDPAVRIGFHARDSHRIVDLGACDVLLPELVALIGPLRRVLAAWLEDRDEASLVMTATATGIDLLLEVKREPGLAAREALAGLAEHSDLARLLWRRPGAAPEPIALRRDPVIRFGDATVMLPPGAFLQPSAAGEAALIAAVCAALPGCRHIADLYAGCGTFTFALARTAAVHAVEGDGAALEALAAATARAGLAGRISTARRDLAREPLSADELARFDGVVFDPPRAGARAQAAALAGSSIPVIVAVSCEPATFARDARIIVDGGYRLESVVPVDQFIWSPHVELVAVFRR